jgi:predicted GNAT superfamily acetyltransferase
MSDDVEIRMLATVADMADLERVLRQIWGSSASMVGVEMMRAVAHGGGYVAGAYSGNQMVGGSFGFLARHRGAPALHSHITGRLPGARHTGVGRAIKLHQRDWAHQHELAWLTWTFDPLVRRNAWFNLEVLGARVEEYLVDFYGPIDDTLNARDETDRVLVAWPTSGEPAVVRAPSPLAVEVPTPDDVITLRRTDPAAAAGWRHEVRRALGGRLEHGWTVTGFSRDGAYLLEEGR